MCVDDVSDWSGALERVQIFSILAEGLKIEFKYRESSFGANC